MKSILIIEDDKNIVELLKFNLEKSEFKVEYSYDGLEGLNMLIVGSYDLVILDLMLPSMDGVNICKNIRKNEALKKLPIIMLTAKSTEDDILMGLEIGADDYITKPFSIKELVSRVKALLRRSKISLADSQVIKIKDLVINSQEHTVYKANKRVELTLKEFYLLFTLAENKNKVLSRSFLLDKIWGYEYIGETRTIDVHIRHLRAKLNDTKLIQTVRGIGYKLEYEE